MQITKEQIQEKIGKLKIEQATLQAHHDNMVKSFQEQQAQFQQVVAGNQNRFQQITGAIAQLTELLATFDDVPPETPAT
jgi:predicted  nucleic acid-binding Zn-ribbon protein